MAKNLVYRLSPVHVGLSIQPNWPAAASVRSGGLVRLGTRFGICLVDHQDTLAGGRHQTNTGNQQSTDRAMTTPVSDFTLNVWELNIPSVLTAVPVGTPVYHYETTNGGVSGDELTTIGALTTSTADFTSGSASVDGSAVDAVGRHFVGTVIEALSGTITSGTSYKVKVMMGS